jgi:uncharacterized protein
MTPLPDRDSPRDESSASPSEDRAARRTVAIVGASSDRAKYGNKSLRAHRQAGYAVYPVNPRGGEIEGERVFARLADIPVPLDRVSLYVPPAIGRQLLPEIAAKGCRELWFNPGSSTAELLDEARRLGLKAISGCSIIDVGASPSWF